MLLCGGGTQSRPEWGKGVTPSSPGWVGGGYPIQSWLGGYPSPQIQTCDGVPPLPRSRCGLTHKVKILPSPILRMRAAIIQCEKLNKAQKGNTQSKKLVSWPIFPSNAWYSKIVIWKISTETIFQLQDHQELWTFNVAEIWLFSCPVFLIVGIWFSAIISTNSLSIRGGGGGGGGENSFSRTALESELMFQMGLNF